METLMMNFSTLLLEKKKEIKKKNLSFATFRTNMLYRATVTSFV